MAKSRRKPKPFIEAFFRLPRTLLRKLNILLENLKDWAVRRLRGRDRDSARSTAGFILPTAVMVILVVTLLTTAIVIRSTDRAKNASNYRVNQVTLNASLPAIERAKRKIDQIFTDPNLPQGAPSDISLYNVLKGNSYTLGDENRLQLAFNNFTVPPGQQRGAFNTGASNDTVSTTAWRYPVDTDNNGIFDSFTLYGIYFRTPPRNASGFARARIPLEARTPPQNNPGLTGFCASAAGTSASLVGADGWFKSGANLKKSFYVYTATVPITNPVELGINDPQRYESYQGNRGFTGLEYQQDRVKIPFGNNAVLYEDDLDLFSGSPLKLNGRVVSYSNLFAAANSSGGLRLYQVSSDESCFYEEENAKILIGGNVGFEPVGKPTQNYNPVTIDLFKGQSVDPTPPVTSSNTSASTSSDRIAYNNQAYDERIAFLVKAIIDPDNNSTTPTPYPQSVNNYPSCKPGCEVTSSDPEAVKNSIKTRINSRTNKKNPDIIRQEELEKWFRDRTRRIPYAEVAFGGNATAGVTNPGDAVVGSGDTLRPIDRWMYPTNIADGGKKGSVSGETQLTLNLNQLAATDPQTRNKEERIGDRILVGNNLPSRFYNATTQQFEANTGEFTEALGQQFIDNGSTTWTKSGTAGGNSGKPRYRKPQVEPSVDLGMTDRDGSWEEDAAKLPEDPLDDKGGLRIVTGAGVYLKGDSPANAVTPNMSNVVWPDWMPAIPNAAQPGQLPGTPPTWLPGSSGGSWNTLLPDSQGQSRPFLRMRSSVVYHYRYDDDNNPDTLAPPIACVSSYYDPTNFETAQNRSGLPNVSGGLANTNLQIPQLTSPNQYAVAASASSNGQSNNGVTYALGQTSASVGVNTADPQLLQQAELVYPNGRLVNPMLREALSKPFAERTFAQNAAIDSALCSLQILGLRGGALSPSTATRAGELPHGTLQEVAFLDGREVKQLEWDDPRTSGRGTNDSTYSSQPLATGQKDSQPAPNKTSEYDLPIEQRQPMEVRVTALDLDVLRMKTVSVGANPNFPDPEYMLPNSGIVYVSRDDALPDASDKPTKPWKNNPDPPANDVSLILAKAELDSDPNIPKDRVSAKDFWLDPTRRPSGVLLTNGKRLSRNNSNTFRAEEKGLILVTNLPAYIKAQSAGATPPGFNLHEAPGNQNEEFTNSLDPTTWSNFYSRNKTQVNRQFACRANDPRLQPDCDTGDQWRAVSVLADAMTILSDNIRFGFRNEGDYDLRNNQVDNGFRNIQIPRLSPTQKLDQLVKPVQNLRLFNGFLNNNFVTNGLSSNNARNVFPQLNNNAGAYTDRQYLGQTAPTPLYSSYFNNFITPIQRRKNFAEYVMEVCRKLPVSECRPGDWVVGYDTDGNGQLQGVERDITTEQLLVSPPAQRLVARLGAGTTALPPLEAGDQRFPRRVAFQRVNGSLKLTNMGGINLPTPIPLGIDGSGQVQSYPYNSAVTNPAHNTDIPRLAPAPNDNNALWFRGSQNPNQPWISNTGTDFTDTRRWLSYENPQPIGPINEANDWLLPDIRTRDVDPSNPNWPSNWQTITDRFNGTNSATPAPADYSVCMASSVSDLYLYSLTSASTGSCPAIADSSAVRNALFGLPTPSSSDPAAPVVVGALPALTLEAKPSSPSPVYIYPVPASITGTITLDAKGQDQPIFVLKSPATQSITFNNVNLVLKGVNPNNVFWVSDGGMIFDGTNQLAGNFLGSGGLTVNSGTTAITNITNGRVLGFTGNFPTSGLTLNAITTQAQPLLAPVLQIHVPQRTNDSPFNSMGDRVYTPNLTHWLPEVANSNYTFNLRVVAGDTPVRPNEFNGALANFPRFMENWSRINSGADKAVTIYGSFIQLKRSTYSTAPFWQLLNATANGTLTPSNNTSNTNILFGYPQAYRTEDAAYQNYEPPRRLWGFDVGLLSQLPDAFAKKLNSNSGEPPNEYYRETSRDDAWVRTLLCATRADGSNARAVNTNQRPATCD